MAFLGGRATLWGPVLGAFILVPIQEYFAQAFGASQLYLIAYAAVFLLIMLFLPRGILPSISDRVRRRRAVIAATAASVDEATDEAPASEVAVKR
jgi:branched-chain amino acid transport system permease protein